MNKSKYASMPLQTISKKVSSALIDGVLLMILGVILTLTLGFEILKNNNDYKESHNNCFENIVEMYKIQDESKLQKLDKEDETKVLAVADYFEEYILKQINLSYKTFEPEFIDAGITLEIKEDNYSTLENDELAYYFVKYKVEHNINLELFENKEPLTYFKEDVLFKNISEDYYLNQNNELPIIKSEVAIRLYNHYCDKENNQDLYYEFSDMVIAIRNIGLNDLEKYEVYDNYYQIYYIAYIEMAKMHNLILLSMFALSFLILIGIPNIVFKNGMSIGKLLTRTRVIHYEDNRIGVLRRLARTLLLFILFTIVIAFISLFTFGFENMAIPLFIVGSVKISFLQIILIGFAFMLINFLLMCFNNEHRSLTDIITGTKQVDVTWFVNK